MMVKPPNNIYEIEIYKLLAKEPEYARYSGGEKSILYDFAVQYIPKYISVKWEDICLKDYLYNIKLVYERNKNQPCLDIICACIKKIFPEYQVELIGNIDNRKLVIAGPYLFQ